MALGFGHRLENVALLLGQHVIRRIGWQGPDLGPI
jgi:hypothetical protein